LSRKALPDGRESDEAEIHVQLVRNSNFPHRFYLASLWIKINLPPGWIVGIAQKNRENVQ